MIKKHIYTILAVILIGAMLFSVSCNSDTDKESMRDETEAQSTEETVTESDSEEMTLSKGPGTKNVIVDNNGDSAVYEKVSAFSLAELGIDASVISDESNIEFLIGEDKLSAFCENGTYYVRIPKIDANGKVTVTVNYGAEAKCELNGEDVFEVTGGDVLSSATDFTGTALIQSPNGDIIAAKLHADGITLQRSSDGGETWTHELIKDIIYDFSSTGWIKDPSGNNKESKSKGAYISGYLSDKQDNALYMMVTSYVQNHCLKLNSHGYVWLNKQGRSELDPELSEYSGINYIWKSSDNGISWELMSVNNDENKPTYPVSYSNAVKTCVADGDGPEVDYVFSVAGSEDFCVTFYTSSLYSCDGGKSWSYSRDRLLLNGGGSWELGNSEPTLVELEDGRLLMIMRNQYDDAIHFARSYSSDHGKTWTELTEDSLTDEVFTVNTQPLLDSFNGYPILLWGGNNIMGGQSYMRFPFNIAVLDKKDGNHVIAQYDLSIGNPELQKYVRSQFTNPGFLIFEYQGKARLAAIGGFNSKGIVVIRDLEDYLDRTTGAYDSFESGLDGWVVMAGRAKSTENEDASDGKSLLSINSGSLVSRSFSKSLRNGTVSFDFTVPEKGLLNFELQTAFNDVQSTEKNKTHPYLHIKINLSKKLVINGKATEMTVGDGMNSVKINFAEDGTVRVSLNGSAEAEVKADLKYGNLVSFVNIWTKDTSAVKIDNFKVFD